MSKVEPIAKEIIDFSDTQIAFSNYSDKELKRKERLFKFMNNSFFVNASSKLGVLAVKMRIPFSEKIIRSTIFKQFCGGRTLIESETAIKRLFDSSIASVLDYGAEAKTSEEDLDHTLSELIKAVEFAGSNASVPVVSTKLTAIAEDDILIKAQTDEPMNAAEIKSFEKAKGRLDKLCKRAKEMKVKIFVDAEESWMQTTMDEMVVEMMQRYNQHEVVVYNTFQMYRHDRLAYLKESYQHAQENGYMLGILRGL